jgi:hypothetical protein
MPRRGHGVAAPMARAAPASASLAQSRCQCAAGAFIRDGLERSLFVVTGPSWPQRCRPGPLSSVVPGCGRNASVRRDPNCCQPRRGPAPGAAPRRAALGWRRQRRADPLGQPGQGCPPGPGLASRTHTGWNAPRPTLLRQPSLTHSLPSAPPSGPARIHDRLGAHTAGPCRASTK